MESLTQRQSPMNLDAAFTTDLALTAAHTEHQLCTGRKSFKSKSEPSRTEFRCEKSKCDCVKEREKVKNQHKAAVAKARRLGQEAPAKPAALEAGIHSHCFTDAIPHSSR